MRAKWILRALFIVLAVLAWVEPANAQALVPIVWIRSALGLLGNLAVTSMTILTGITVFRGDATTGNTMASVLASSDLTAQDASIGSTPLFTPNVAGKYRASASIEVNTAATTGTIALNLEWTGVSGARNKDILTLNIAAPDVEGGSVEFWAEVGAVSYTGTITGLTGTPSFDVHVTVERLS